MLRFALRQALDVQIPNLRMSVCTILCYRFAPQRYVITPPKPKSLFAPQTPFTYNSRIYGHSINSLQINRILLLQELLNIPQWAICSFSTSKMLPVPAKNQALQFHEDYSWPASPYSQIPPPPAVKNWNLSSFSYQHRSFASPARPKGQSNMR